MIEPSRGRRGQRGARDGQPPEPPADPVAAAKDICLRLLTDRPRTKAELEKKLATKGIPPEAADQVLNRLNAVGLIDDAAFAEQWVQSRHRYQGMAKRALVAELKRKGVDNETATEAAEAVGGEAEESRARDLVRKRLRSVTGQDEVTKVRRLVGMLARKGYPEGLSYRVVREELKTAGEETDLLDEATPE